jgi:hypothetical protein
MQSDTKYTTFELPVGRRAAQGPTTDEERQIRIELAAAYRLCALFGWDDLIYSHISIRSGMMPALLCTCIPKREWHCQC